MFKSLGRFTASHPWFVCASWVAIAAVLFVFAPSWDSSAQDDDIHFLPERCASVRGYALLAKAFPQDVFASRLIFAVERPTEALTAADFMLVDQLVADLEQLRTREPELLIGRLYSHHDPFIGKRLVSADGHCTLIQVSLGSPFLALQTRTTVDRAEACVRQRLQSPGPTPPRLLATGPAGVGRDLISVSASGLDGTTWATIALVLFVLLLVYRAPLLALVPLLTIAVSVGVALKLLAFLTLVPGVHLVTVSKIFAVVILYGAGTDYCLFLISRYREELTAGHAPTEAVQRACGAVGGALAASAGTVICGLGLMACAEFAKVRCAGPAIALCLAVALTASLTLTPAVLVLLGRVAFWPCRSEVVGLYRPRARSPRWTLDAIWERLSRLVVARPGPIFCVSLALLLPLAALGVRIVPAYRPTGELALTAGSVVGLDVLQKHFTAGEVGPITVLLSSTGDWNTAAGRRVVEHLNEGFCRLDNVAEVRSLTRPLGATLPEPLPRVQGHSLLGNLLRSVQDNLGGALLERGQQAASGHYTATVPALDGSLPRHVTRLDVVLKSDPFDAASLESLEVLQTWLRTELDHTTRHFAATTADCYGVTVNARDLAAITEADRTRINSLVTVGIFLILLVLVRRPWLAAYLLVTVLLSYYAALGATALVSWHWLGRPLGQVDWRVPFFLFTILVAVGEDYNILLISRILQEKKRLGTDRGVERALARTGGTISACGLIMAGTFATLMLAGLNTLVQVGFALAFGVLLDTFIVRPFLVPAFVLLVWRAIEPIALPNVPFRKPAFASGFRRAG